MASDPYAKLVARLNQCYLGAPLTDELLVILRELFTPEEAGLAAVIPDRAPSAAKIAERAGQPVALVERSLESMVKKGLLLVYAHEGVRRYKFEPVLPGLAETYTYATWRNPPGPAESRMAQLFDEYYRKTLAPEIFQGTPWVRVLTVEKDIPSYVEAFPYDRVSEIIKGASSLALLTCFCRQQKALLGRACNAPKEACMAFGPFAEYLITELGIGRRMTQEGMLRVLDQVEQAGLVHVTWNAESDLSFICNCCGDCCAFLGAINQLNRLDGIAKSSFRAVMADEECIGCAACLDRCQVKALSMPDQLAIIDAHRCIGCGLCVSACPTSAITLQRREQASAPFATIYEMESAIRAERGLG